MPMTKVFFRVMRGPRCGDQPAQVSADGGLCCLLAEEARFGTISGYASGAFLIGFLNVFSI